MKIKSISYNYVYKKMGDIQVGDKVLGPSGEKFTVLETTDHGLQDVYKIILSDGRSFESMGSHLSTVHFRNSHVRPDKKVYDTVTTDFIKDHIQEYVFEIPTDDTFSWTELDYFQLIEMLPLHEYEPIDKQCIIPDLNKNSKKVYIERIEKLEKQKECRCIALNYPWGLYIIEHGILTHNSLLSNLIFSYLIVLFGMMRQPYRILGHSSVTSYCLAMCAATLTKAWDILGIPFEQFLEQSPYFEKVGRHDDIVAINKEDEDCKKCYYTTAARGSNKMLFRNNLSMAIISTEGGLLGRAQPLYSKIKLPDGSYKCMGNIALGDKIASPTEKETEVVGIFPQGKRDVYEIELEDGRKARASDNHLWKVAIDKKEDQSWNWQIVDTLQLIQWLEQDIEIEIYDGKINRFMKIKSIRYIGQEECQCIKVSAKDEMYITAEKEGEDVCTHNTMIGASLTEISWWTKNNWTNEDIFTFFTKAKQRVDSRMNGHYLGRCIIDSSPFSLESPIDKWIWEKAITDPTWYCVLGSRWDYIKQDFPNFFDANGKEIHDWKHAFQVYKGGKSEPPKACLSENEANLYDPLDLVWCPREQINSKGTLSFVELALQSPVEFLRDYAGIPAGSSDRIFQSANIVEAIFDNDLKNMYTSIVADALEEPEHLIWNKVKDVFFINFNNNYMFYREPNVKRVLCVDQSLSGDCTALSIAHNEFIKTNTGDVLTVMVVDMTLVIIPKGGQINLEAIKFFIMDLIERGNMNIGMVSFDTFQSASTKQYLLRKKVEIDYISVDKNNEHYATLVDRVMHNRVFCGKNIFLKNNLRSLHIAQRDSGSFKYDHFKGKLCNESEDLHWETSQLGINAKDVADTVCACQALLTKYDVDFTPTHEWVPKRTEEEKKKAVEKKLDLLGVTI